MWKPYLQKSAAPKMMTPSRREPKAERAPQNFSIRQDVRYESLGKRGFFGYGTGTSIEISSRLIRFTTETDLRPGQKIRLAMDWPIMLSGSCRLQLQICGCVIESRPGQATAEIGRYEFRTLPKQEGVVASASVSKAAHFRSYQPRSWVRSRHWYEEAAAPMPPSAVSYPAADAGILM